MPAFNVEPFVGGAIDSVRSQTFEDFELLVVDDGSTMGPLPSSNDTNVRIVGCG